MPRALAHSYSLLAERSGVSEKSLKAWFKEHGAPKRTLPLEDLLKLIEARFSGVAKLPPDLAQQKILIDFETKKSRRDKEKEWAEEKRLKNLRSRGKLIERDDVKAQGAAVGLALSSVISGFEKDGPGMCVGKSEIELHRLFREHSDKLRDMIRDSLEKLSKLRGSENE
jgi:hypothetical protein